VVPDRALDRRDGEAREVVATLGVEAVDCFDQPDRADLYEILEPFPPVRIAPCERTHERQVTLDEPLSRSRVTTRAIRPDECGCIVSASKRVPSCSCIARIHGAVTISISPPR
jgi:hypothetical protein